MKQIKKTDYPRKVYRQLAAESYRESRRTSSPSMREWYEGRASAFKLIEEGLSLAIGTYNLTK